MREQGAHPVIYLSLGSVRHESWEGARARIAALVADEANRHGYLLDSEYITTPEKDYLLRLMSENGSASDVETSLSRLSTMLARHHSSSTVILIDEYDQIATAGYIFGYLSESVNFMRAWLTDALKATTSLYLACLTGVQRISRESIFSGLSNLEVNTALSSEFTEGFGFTEAEVACLSRYVGVNGHMPEMNAWYDGYRFGDNLVYNPWSVLNYLGKGGVPQPYWGNTSDNAIVHSLFGLADATMQDDLLTLARGESLRKPLDLSTVFGDLGENDAVIWSQLYLAGYLTTDDVGSPEDSSRVRALRIPNGEVGMLFRKEFLDRTSELAGGAQRLQPLHAALVAGDAVGFENALTAILRQSASAYDLVRENSYHMLMLGLLFGVPGYGVPLSNAESGDGRYDIALQPVADQVGKLPGIVLELKWGSKSSRARLDGWAHAALQQIEEKGYSARVHGAGCLKWGVACSGKSIAARCVRDSR